MGAAEVLTMKPHCRQTKQLNWRNAPCEGAHLTVIFEENAIAALRERLGEGAEP